METILLYNIAGTPLAAALKPLLLKMKFRVKIISPAQYRQQIGFLAGVHGFSDNGTLYEGEAFEEPMLVLCHLTEQRLDRFLLEMRQKKIPKIALKAVLTAQNQTWDSLTLYHELKAEHEALNS